MAVVLDNHLSELQQARHLLASPTTEVVACDAHGRWAITITSDRVADHMHHVPGSERGTWVDSQLITRPFVDLRLGLEEAQLIAVCVDIKVGAQATYDCTIGLSEIGAYGDGHAVFLQQFDAGQSIRIGFHAGQIGIQHCLNFSQTPLRQMDTQVLRRALKASIQCHYETGIIWRGTSSLAKPFLEQQAIRLNRCLAGKDCSERIQNHCFDRHDVPDLGSGSKHTTGASGADQRTEACDSEQ